MTETAVETTRCSPIDFSRRQVLRGSLPLGAVALVGLPVHLASGADTPVPGSFPRTSDDAAREMVGVAHRDLDRVRALLAVRPSLANAAWDWGFGDWETALGAASHVGRPDIGEALIGAGARPDLFTHAMFGHLDAVRASVEAQPGIQRGLGPHGITLLAHARAGGEAAVAVVRYLEQLGDADRGARSAPLDRPLTAFLGSYAYGSGATERFQIVEQRGSLALLREGGFGHGLLHLGTGAFHAVGAPAVRIEFRFEGGREPAASVIVRDADLVLTATRTG